MLSAQRLDDNPCRPRHFKPPPCAPVIADDATGALIETTRARLRLAAVVFAAIFLLVAGRLTQVVEISGGAAAAGEPHLAHNPVTPPPVRADIVDRNGTLLATNLDSPALYVDSKAMLQAGESPEAAARAITSALPDLSAAEIRAKLASGKSFAYLTRSLTPRQEYAVNNLGIPGVEFQPGEKRRYPLGDLMSHVLGYCSVDNIGQAGLERGLNPTIKDGKPVMLAIDARVQFVLRDELQQVITQFDAKGAAGIIMNVHTGEIVAMASLPDFDPNHPPSTDPKRETTEDKDRIFNKITSGEYELGSVFKIFNTAMALDSGVATMTSTFDARNPIEIGRFTIEDYHGKHRILSVPEIFAYSSNIGSARMAVAAGADRQKSFLAKLGLLQPVPIEFDKVEVAKPHYPAIWREVNVMTIAFGHGIAVTPLHMITATAAMINGGILHPPTMLKVSPTAKVAGVRVISEKTSDQVRRLMRLVVESGTAKLAAAPGYVVGGKTGTAEKNTGGHYEEKKLLSSFIGAFPMNDPQYVILTLVDEPHGNKESHGYATAGWTVAPATSHIIQRIAPLLGVAPVDENSPEIVKALQIDSLAGKHIEDY